MLHSASESSSEDDDKENKEDSDSGNYIEVEATDPPIRKLSSKEAEDSTEDDDDENEISLKQMEANRTSDEQSKVNICNINII